MASVRPRVWAGPGLGRICKPAPGPLCHFPPGWQLEAVRSQSAPGCFCGSGFGALFSLSLGGTFDIVSLAKTEPLAQTLREHLMVLLVPLRGRAVGSEAAWVCLPSGQFRSAP